MIQDFDMQINDDYLTDSDKIAITQQHTSSKSAQAEVSFIKMIPYNTGLPRMVLPEYGRNIQQMATNCLSIEDREERTRCAYEIIDVMVSLFPNMVGDNGNLQKLWDHLNMMCDFKLDIDFPIEVADQSSMHPKPAKVPYTTSGPYHRQYGRLLPQIVKIVSDMPNCDDKDVLVSMVAHHMKKMLLSQNKDGVSDSRVLADLSHFSGGLINLDPEEYILHDFFESMPQIKTKKKKKK
ncbi:MAG: DUF4290 domain-containing protein [Muribaculaceae bacterium]|nr:DUF4290 domain-containing protein [Muribaculaceae bacterium]